jgi:hypothetical protein
MMIEFDPRDAFYPLSVHVWFRMMRIDAHAIRVEIHDGLVRVWSYVPSDDGYLRNWSGDRVIDVRDINTNFVPRYFRENQYAQT